MNLAKKILVTICLTAVTLTAISAYTWYWWIPNIRPKLEANQSYALDVSRHQGDINWEQVAGDNIKYAYVKATEGGDWIDPKFDDNAGQATEQGIKVGAYHFFTLCTKGKLQAENFLAKIVDSPADLPPAVDIELGGNCSNPPDNATIKTELETFIEIVEAETNKQLVFYVLEGFDYLESETLAGKPRWRRSLFRKPANMEWIMWQYSGEAYVDGVEGRVDLNVISNDIGKSSN